MPDVHGLHPDTIKALKRDHDWIRQQVRDLQGELRRKDVGEPHGVLVAKADAEVSQASYGNFSVWKLTDADGAWEKERTIVAWDWMRTGCEAGDEVLLFRLSTSSWVFIRLGARTWQSYLGSDQTVLHSASATTLQIGSEQYTDDNFSLSSYELSVAQEGRYMVSVNIHVEQGTYQAFASPRTCKSWMERYNGSSWAAVPGSLAIVDVGYTTDGKCCPTFLVDHTDDDHKYRLRGERFEGDYDNENAIYQGYSGAEGCFWTWQRV